MNTSCTYMYVYVCTEHVTSRDIRFKVSIFGQHGQVNMDRSTGTGQQGQLYLQATWACSVNALHKVSEGTAATACRSTYTCTCSYSSRPIWNTCVYARLVNETSSPLVAGLSASADMFIEKCNITHKPHIEHMLSPHGLAASNTNSHRLTYGAQNKLQI